MNINLRRNYPIILILIALVSILVFAIGDWRVIAYTTATPTKAAMTDKDRFHKRRGTLRRYRCPQRSGHHGR